MNFDVAVAGCAVGLGFCELLAAGQSPIGRRMPSLDAILPHNKSSRRAKKQMRALALFNRERHH
jgi:hypothetical protein